MLIYYNGDNMKYAYKVVSRYRESSNVFHKKYELIYAKDSIVQANRNTLGIFLFKTKQNAQNFMGVYDRLLKVELLENWYIPSSIGIIEYIENYYACNKKCYKNNYVYPGTICCYKIKVLT